MLYVTTRNNRDPFTVSRALGENRGTEGGFFLPFHAPRFSREEIEALAEKSFGQNVADVLNLLFSTRLTGWDVEFGIGRNPVRLEALRQKFWMAEPWYNPQWDYEWVVRSLTRMICQEEAVPGDWIRLGVRIALRFGLFGQLQKQGVEKADISVVSGDFTVPISAWYARSWGLPIGNIVCCCNENNRLWDLMVHGQMRTDGISVPTAIPEADVIIPAALERLIYEWGGIGEVERYLRTCAEGRTYAPSDSLKDRLRSGLFVSVVSSDRIESIIPGVCRTHGYTLSAQGALAYSGLLDYRAKTGQTRHGIVWAEKSPAQDAPLIAKILGVTPDEVQSRFL